MRNTSYIYNNEAIFVCIILLLLKKTNLDFARLLVLVSLLADSRFTKYISNIDNIQFYEIIQEKVLWFSNYNQRYLELLPIIINSLVILQKEHAIILNKTEFSFNREATLKDLNLADSGNRLDEISKAIPELLFIVDKYDTQRIYKLLNIQL